MIWDKDHLDLLIIYQYGSCKGVTDSIATVKTILGWTSSVLVLSCPKQADLWATIVVLLDSLLLLPHAFTSKCELSWHTFVPLFLCYIHLYSLKHFITNSVLWLHGLWCEFDYFWNIRIQLDLPHSTKSCDLFYSFKQVGGFIWGICIQQYWFYTHPSLSLDVWPIVKKFVW